MLAAFGVCSPELWMTLFKWLRLRTVHPVLLVSHCYFVLNTCFFSSYVKSNGNNGNSEYNYNSLSKSHNDLQVEQKITQETFSYTF